MSLKETRVKINMREATMTARKLLIATHNQGKIREFRDLLADLPVEVTWLAAEGITFEAEETQETFAGNAAQKAEAYATASGLWTWADDSGLAVDALGGRPGVYSARYGGAGLTQPQRNALLLEELAPIAPELWTARFHCAVAIALPSTSGGNAEIHIVDGMLEGRITDQPRGNNGFGYDPLFLLPERGETLAELENWEKNRISHRARASVKAREVIAELLRREKP